MVEPFDPIQTPLRLKGYVVLCFDVGFATTHGGTSGKPRAQPRE
jgi:hypothetical protein